MVIDNNQKDEVPLTVILNYILSEFNVRDIKLQEISTESVIKEIFEGGLT